ncbi:MAG: PQQ-binding-like beta-propeller repeat protein, partial [Gammaproteobacteria bacterium]|nr:PQQ-binding-like beta-propeller repeat protein [Gammaproteobacteria bacterium]
TNCKVQVATACSGTMNARVSDASDTRTIKTANSTGTGLVDFTYANLSTTQKTYFDAAHIGTLSQWADFTADQKTAAAGNNLVNFLRGQYGYENRNANAEENRLYRFREAVLGDALESQPAFMANPVFSYPYPGYSTYKDDQVSRAGKVYLGANDGMLHAFDAATGAESWAYVPSMVIPNMWKLAEMNYGTSHANFVNGSPVTSDICYANCNDPATAVWKTILVAGLNGGGRGYYALDITDPASPALLWEFTTTAGIGSVTDDDVGFGFGQAIITRKNDGTWVVLVTSGYNNTSPGDGMGYLYVLDAASGDILSKISTGVGSTTTPSGLAKIAGYNEEPGGNKAGYIYGGDLLGNVWRFDINSSTTAAIGTGDKLKFATLYSETAGTTPQPIMTTPVLGKINGKRYIFISTGKYLEQSDLTTTQPHSMYSIKDDDATTTLVNPRLTLIQQTLTNNLDGTRSSTSHAVDTSSTRGCFVDFPDSGERANIDAKLVQGILIAPTIVPSNTACNPGGYGWLNYFDYATCGGTAVKYDSTIVGINVIYIDDPIVQVVTSENPTPDKPELQPEFKGSASGFIGKRTLWRELIPQ